MVRVTVNHQVSAVPVDDLRQTRGPKIWENFRRLALDSGRNRRVVENNDRFRGPKLGHSALQLQRLIDRGFHERLYFWFAKRCENTSAESTDKALCPCKSHTVALIRSAVQYLDPLRRHHFHEFFLLARLVVVIAQNGDDGQPQADKYVDQRLHFIGLAEIGEIAGDYQYVSLVADARQLVF